MATNERSFSDILQDVVRNIQEIVRSEVRLAKTEVREEVGKAKSAGILTGAGAVCGVYASFFTLLAGVYALARVVPDWSASLIVGVVLAIIAGVTLAAGMKQFRTVHPTPDRTIENFRENVEWAKQQTK